MKSDANIHITNRDGRTALYIAVSRYNTEVASLILRTDPSIVNITDNSDATILHMAAERCDIEILSALLNMGANVDAIDDNGNTALHITSRLGDAEKVSRLLESGANANRTNNDGKTALQLAVENDHTQIAKVLDYVINERDVSKPIEAIVPAIDGENFNNSRQNDIEALTIVLDYRYEGSDLIKRNFKERQTNKKLKRSLTF